MTLAPVLACMSWFAARVREHSPHQVAFVEEQQHVLVPRVLAEVLLQVPAARALGVPRVQHLQGVRSTFDADMVEQVPLHSWPAYIPIRDLILRSPALQKRLTITVAYGPAEPPQFHCASFAFAMSSTVHRCCCLA